MIDDQRRLDNNGEDEGDWLLLAPAEWFTNSKHPDKALEQLRQLDETRYREIVPAVKPNEPPPEFEQVFNEDIAYWNDCLLRNGSAKDCPGCVHHIVSRIAARTRDEAVYEIDDLKQVARFSVLESLRKSERPTYRTIKFDVLDYIRSEKRLDINYQLMSDERKKWKVDKPARPVYPVIYYQIDEDGVIHRIGERLAR